MTQVTSALRPLGERVFGQRRAEMKLQRRSEPPIKAQKQETSKTQSQTQGVHTMGKVAQDKHAMQRETRNDSAAVYES